jgi:IS605 OrfB family transposase
MSFGGATVPDGYVVRTFRVKVMATKAKQRQAFGLLEAGGDVRAWCIDRFHARIRAGLPNANSVTQMWPDQKEHGPFGQLTAHCAQDITRGWSDSFFEVMRRRAAGDKASLPLKKRRLVPVTWRKGEFRLTAATPTGRARVELSLRRGCDNLVLSLSHDHPYDPNLVRAVRLIEEAGDLFADITAWVAVVPARTDPEVAAGVDPGIIHPLAVASQDQALLVSGRAVRAEEFLHLEDTKTRDRHLAAKRAPRRARPGRPRQEGSRRWKKLAARQRRQEAKNRRVVKQAGNRAANLAAAFIVDQARAATVAVGDPKRIEDLDAGRRHNRRIHRWARTHTRNALTYRLQECGINARLVDERGTSSSCPTCGAAATKNGRHLTCQNPTCHQSHHRDIAGAQNMVRKLGHAPTDIAHTEHRRVGTPARRDRRRHLYDQTRSTKAPPGPARTRARRPKGQQSLTSTANAA